jgi:nicotinamidase-related amidase
MNNTALLVMHLQNRIIGNLAEGSNGLDSVGQKYDPTPLLENVGRATSAARAAGIPVIYVNLGFRAGTPEVSERSGFFAALTAAYGFEPDAPDSQVHPAVAPSPDDIIVINKRISAFTGSDLEIILRSLDIRTLVFTGIATRGVVLSTFRQAADLDFELAVLDDGCGDPDLDVHRVLMDKVFAMQAKITDTYTWISELQRTPALQA